MYKQEDIDKKNNKTIDPRTIKDIETLKKSLSSNELEQAILDSK